jgi:hypothetical protein
MPDINDLWTSHQGGPTSWYDSSPVEVRTFIQRLAELVVEKGRDPNWEAVLRYIRGEWPESAPARALTITDAVRKLVRS